jgi:predicted porin
MRLNKLNWALAIAGAVAIPTLARAEEQKLPSVLTSVASTTLSGYVDTSAQWNFGTGNANNPPYSFGGASKADGFNLNVVDLALDHPIDESPWAAGYHVELWMGPDADSLGTQSFFNNNVKASAGDFAVRQAYIMLHAPIGNGLDFKVGVFDSIIGYEGFSSPSNPNYTRSYGFTIEPSQHVGVLSTYKFTDSFSASVGVADTYGPAINGRADAESVKTYMGLLTLTCPTNCGFLAGSTFSAGVVDGTSTESGGVLGNDLTSVYVGGTINTPITALKFGGSLDWLDIHNAVPGNDGNIWVFGVYGSYQATEKLGFYLRGEHVNMDGEANAGNFAPLAIPSPNDLEEITFTAQYDLWKNVLSRVEFRWDHAEHGDAFGGTVTGTPTRENAFMLAANVIYKF